METLTGIFHCLFPNCLIASSYLHLRNETLCIHVEIWGFPYGVQAATCYKIKDFLKQIKETGKIRSDARQQFTIKISFSRMHISIPCYTTILKQCYLTVVSRCNGQSNRINHVSNKHAIQLYSGIRQPQCTQYLIYNKKQKP